MVSATISIIKKTLILMMLFGFLVTNAGVVLAQGAAGGPVPVGGGGFDEKNRDDIGVGKLSLIAKHEAKSSYV
jgi:hypothetical protein